jgi:hypothetical protein
MATYVLIHGASSDTWYWHRVVPLLGDRGHEAEAPDLPIDDDVAGLGEYADTVIDAVDNRRDLILVAQSMVGFNAPIICTRMLGGRAMPAWGCRPTVCSIRSPSSCTMSRTR